MLTITLDMPTAPKAQQGPAISSPQVVADLCCDMQEMEREMMICIMVNQKNRIIDTRVIGIGSTNSCIVTPRDVYRLALLTGAQAILLVHNHPSGDPTPSGEDRALTKRIKEAGDLLGVKLLDHVIMARDGYYSISSDERYCHRAEVAQAAEA